MRPVRAIPLVMLAIAAVVSTATAQDPAVIGATPPPRDTTPAADAPSDAPDRIVVPLADDAVFLVRASVHGLTAPARWSGREWGLASASVGAVALASVLDESGRQLMADMRNDRNTGVELFIEPFGAERSLQLMAGLLAAGLVLDDPKLRGTAVEGLAAGLVAGGIITPTLQLVIGRAKPRAGVPAHTFDPFSGNRSLPSGHTTQAFAIASVLATEYDHPLVQVGAYGMATAVGVSRMYRRSHFLSDVVGAAILGTAVGTTVARFGIERRGQVSVTPHVAGGSAGLVLRLVP